MTDEAGYVERQISQIVLQQERQGALAPLTHLQLQQVNSFAQTMEGGTVEQQ